MRNLLLLANAAVVLLAAGTAVGCRSASNSTSAFKSNVLAEPPAASTAPLTPLASQPATANANPQTSAIAARNEPGMDGAPVGSDQLRGYYPEDYSTDSVALDSNDVKKSGSVTAGWSGQPGNLQSVPRTGSFSSAPSGGCSSGCCSK